jgi:hypothetical protein
MIKGAMLAAAVLLISACSSNVVKPQDDPIVTTLTGKPVAYVQGKLGLPNRRNDLATGAMVWVYFDNDKGGSERECQVAVSIRGGIVENVHITTSNPSLLSYAATPCQRIRKQLTAI